MIREIPDLIVHLIVVSPVLFFAGAMLYCWIKDMIVK